MKKALIAGSTGAVGSKLLHLLLDSGVYEKVIAVVRRPLNLSHPRLDYRIVDFDNPDYESFTDDVDDVFVTLGTTIKKAGTKENFVKVDYDYVMMIANLAKKLHAQKFLVVSSLIANTRSSNYYMGTKGRMEVELQKYGFKSLCIFRPSLLIADRDEFRFGEKAGEWLFKLLNPLLVGRLRKYRSVKVEEVALAMYSVAQKMTSGINIIERDEMERIILSK